MSDIGSTAKEMTILDRTVETRKAVADLRILLDSKFDKRPQETGELQPETHPLNVLDEIADNIVDSNNKLLGIISYLQNDILPKICD